MPASVSTHDFERKLGGRRILVTGHTGFTGSWATQWLSMIGAEVHGFSLPAPTSPNLFEDADAQAGLASHTIGDVGDFGAVDAAIQKTKPELILHLAAQPLVRRSYRDPIETYQANVMGTVHVLEAARRHHVVGAVCITTDKVYYNREWAYGYRETDRLGGSDPYSASKSAAELVIDSYRSSMESWGQSMLIAAARGGNIIGGGDWAEDRLIPDFARAARSGTPITLRNPAAIRPWQHVLALIHGYMMLLARMTDGDTSTSSAWNLGPAANATLTVGEVVARLRARWDDLTVKVEPTHLHETTTLALDSTKASRQLGWKPGWSTEQGIDRTADWYAAYVPGVGASAAITRSQIQEYRAALAQ